jgi:8-oxo-dGTP pyrophosphatase MutT (NUDIX family)
VSVTAAAVLADLAAHRPGDEAERRSLARARALIRWLPRPLDQAADPTHVTGSAIVLDACGRVLLHRHKRLGIWLQPGGHLDPGEHPAQAARRETLEETGVAAEHPDAGPHLLHVDVHEGPRGHVHLDLRYLLHGDGDAPLRPAPGESPDVAWVERDEVPRLADASLAAAVRAAAAPAVPHLTRRRGGLR